MSIRLTNRIRDRIVGAATEKKFDFTKKLARKFLDKAIIEYLSQTQGATIPSFLIKDGWIATSTRVLFRIFPDREAFIMGTDGPNPHYDIEYYEPEMEPFPTKSRAYSIEVPVIKDYEHFGGSL